jgi:hypothetical protein
MADGVPFFDAVVPKNKSRGTRVEGDALCGDSRPRPSGGAQLRWLSPCRRLESLYKLRAIHFPEASPAEIRTRNRAL